jgi:hypothetical protein
MEILTIRAVLLKKNKKITLQQFLPLSEAESQGLRHPAETNLGYCVVSASKSCF